MQLPNNIFKEKVTCTQKVHRNNFLVGWELIKNICMTELQDMQPMPIIS